MRYIRHAARPACSARPPAPGQSASGAGKEREWLSNCQIARSRIYCLVAIRETTRNARIETFELGEGFQPYHPSFRMLARVRAGGRAEGEGRRAKGAGRRGHITNTHLS